MVVGLMFVFLRVLYHVSGFPNSLFTISGEITPMYNETFNSSMDRLRSSLLPGEEIIFQFAFHLSRADTISSVQFIVNGTRLQFSTKLHTQRSIQVFAEFETMNKSFFMELAKSGSVPKVNTSTKINSDFKSAVITVDNNGFPLKLIHGEFRMVVSKKLLEGKIQSFMYVTCSPLSEGTPYTMLVTSTPFSTPVASMDIGRCSPEHLGLRQKTRLQINVTMTPGTLDKSYVFLYLPSTTNKEAKMTVNYMLVDNVIGVTRNEADLLMKTSFLRQSPTLTSECNLALLPLPHITAKKKTKIIIKTESFLQDFVGFKDGQSLEINVGFKVNEDSIWIGRTHVFIDDTIPSTAIKEVNLETSLTEIHRYIERDRMLSRFRLTLAHTQTSMATAYNVSVIMYISPSLTFLKTSRKFVDAVKPFSVAEEAHGTVRIEFSRVSFSHLSKFVFNVTTDGLRDKFEAGQRPLLVYEVVYTGWRDQTDLALDLTYQIITLPVFQKLIWNVTLTCPCPFNPSLQNCACCKPTDCFCGQHYPDKCSACDERWKCLPILPEYFKQSVLVDEQNNTVVCDNRENKRMGKAFTSCLARDKAGKTYYFPPNVATILGVDLRSGFLYGIGNTGVGFVRSTDNGITWVSIARHVVFRAMTAVSFRNSTLI